MNFPLAVAQAVRDALGPKLTAGFRVTPFETEPDGYTPANGETVRCQFLPPPACPRPCVLRAISLAARPRNNSDFSFELRTPVWQSRPIPKSAQSNRSIDGLVCALSS